MFSTKAKGYIYWQCFPRDSITISLDDLGYSPEDDPDSSIKYNGEDDAKLIIIAQGKHGIIHKYVMWGNYPISMTEKRFNIYLKLMRGEKNILNIPRTAAGGIPTAYSPNVLLFRRFFCSRNSSI